MVTDSNGVAESVEQRMRISVCVPEHRPCRKPWYEEAGNGMRHAQKNEQAGYDDTPLFPRVRRYHEESFSVSVVRLSTQRHRLVFLNSTAHWEHDHGNISVRKKNFYVCIECSRDRGRYRNRDIERFSTFRDASHNQGGITRHRRNRQVIREAFERH